MRNLFSNLDPEEVIRITRDLVQIPSANPPGEETRVAEYISHELANLGFKVDLYEVDKNRSNVVGLLRGKGKGPTLMLNGHTDVVPPGDSSAWNFAPFDATVSGDRIYGRGTVDMKGAIAAMLTAAKAVVNSGAELRGNLLFTAVVDEEQGGMGTKSLLEKGYTADMAIIGEPTELKVQIAHKGVIWLEITTLGEAVHGSRVRSKNPRVGINAIYKMARAVSAFERYLLELEKRENSLVGNPTVNVGTIVGGNKPNIVPDRCTVVLERRLVPGETSEGARSEVEDILTQIETEDHDFNARTKVMMTRESSAISPEEPVVKLCRNAVKSVTGIDPGVSGFVAGTDMHFLVAKNIPTVILGPGSLSQAHNANEFIEKKQLNDAVKIYAQVILDGLQ